MVCAVKSETITAVCVKLYASWVYSCKHRRTFFIARCRCIDELMATKVSVLVWHDNSDHVFSCPFLSCEIALYFPFEVQDLTNPLLETGTVCEWKSETCILLWPCRGFWWNQAATRGLIGGSLQSKVKGSRRKRVWWPLQVIGLTNYGFISQRHYWP